MDTQALTHHRKDKDEFFGQSPHSPVPPEGRSSFAGLSYFEPNSDLIFTVEPTPFPPEPVEIQTTTGDVRTYHKVATASVAVEGVAIELALYSTGHDSLFLPFRDATSGNESYGAGRYLDIDPNPDGTVTIDFNYAYAPFCAYSDRYSCALPPVENWLTVPIKAGERVSA
ncbi:MAG: DUF1684 domain-containing protein [Actinomycetota bacterium]